MRGLPTDSEDVRLSKTLSWILRHGSQSEGLYMRPDGYIRVQDLLNSPRLRTLTFEKLEELVKADKKTRFNLTCGPDPSTGSSKEIWWIRANQGHSMKSVVLELEELLSPSDIPSGIAVHGTTRNAWDIIRKEGLSKMNRNHIHLAQGVPASNVISGMRNSSQILIYVNVQKALSAGIKFYLSANGVVLTDGNERGYLDPQFFQRIVDVKGKPVPKYHVSEAPVASASTSSDPAAPAETATVLEEDPEVIPTKEVPPPLSLEPAGSPPPVDHHIGEGKVSFV